ncbi:hypothetical protein JOL62DRAFT_397407 [Phyllosticta paracitricarpa]|uniref:Uncharacterized protein n=1 Tax=Phyllosticta paracitricarpa TaxID=2016321 RepID=A0ABR1MSB9_9PEZI
MMECLDNEEAVICAWYQVFVVATGVHCAGFKSRGQRLKGNKIGAWSVERRGSKVSWLRALRILFESLVEWTTMVAGAIAVLRVHLRCETLRAVSQSRFQGGSGRKKGVSSGRTAQWTAAKIGPSSTSVGQEKVLSLIVGVRYWGERRAVVVRHMMFLSSPIAQSVSEKLDPTRTTVKNQVCAVISLFVTRRRGRHISDITFR